MRCLSIFAHLLVAGLFVASTGCEPEKKRAAADAGPPDTGPSDTGVDAGPGDTGVDAGPPPRFRNPLETEDSTLANQALRILGAREAGGMRSCTQCHGITRTKISQWRSVTDTIRTECLTDPDSIQTQEDAEAFLACLGTNVTPTRLGIFATAAPLDWFEYVLELANRSDAQAFIRAARMPQSGMRPLSQSDFDIVAEWFDRGTPNVEDILPEGRPIGPCATRIDPEVATHVTAMATEGWTARNLDNGMLMYGCVGAASPEECLTGKPLARDTVDGATWDVIPETHLRVLYTTDYTSSYWTRSSADGRFVAHGGGRADAGASFIDLQRDVVIPAAAAYDPGFFPDNSGLVFQGASAPVCEMSVLTTGSPTAITFDEPQCRSGITLGLYQHMGASLDGADYWGVYGEFVSDFGGGAGTVLTADPAATFSGGSETNFTRMLNDGSGFVPAGRTSVAIPHEGDTVISPSSRLIVTRIASEDGSGQYGYSLRAVVNTTPEGGELSVLAPEIALYCATGGKPGFSYDERWMVIHHYIGDADAVELGFTGADDPAFADYRTAGAANIYLIDLLTGDKTRLTNMRPGQYAMFPHFRSDGWIYFIVRTEGLEGEHMVASDAALELATP